MGTERPVSILIATYNAEKFIGKTLRSCLDQTYCDIEILVRDNNSADNTVAVIEAIKSDKIKLFKGETNIGPYAGLNFLLEKAKGDYIAIQDHDDIWFPEKIEKQVEFMGKNEEFVGCGTDTFYFFENEKLFALKKFKKVENYINHTSLMFRNKGFRYKTDINLPEYFFEKQILSASGRIGCIQDGLTIHRIRNDGKNFSKKSKLSGKENFDFLKMNNFSLKSAIFVVYLAIRKFMPKCMVWFMRKHVTMRKSEWLSEDEFTKKFPQINF